MGPQFRARLSLASNSHKLRTRERAFWVLVYLSLLRVRCFNLSWRFLIISFSLVAGTYHRIGSGVPSPITFERVNDACNRFGLRVCPPKIASKVVIYNFRVVFAQIVWYTELRNESLQCKYCLCFRSILEIALSVLIYLPIKIFKAMNGKYSLVRCSVLWKSAAFYILYLAR